MEIDVSYKTIYRRVQRFLRALDAPRPQLEGSVETDELYVKAGLKGRDCDGPSRSRCLSTRGRGTYAEDQPPVFILADRESGDQYVIPAKAANESTIRLLLADRQQESLTIYTDGFRAYEPLDEDDAFTREYVVHGDGEYVDGDHVNTCESHASLAPVALAASRCLQRQTHTVSLSVPTPPQSAPKTREESTENHR